MEQVSQPQELSERLGEPDGGTRNPTKDRAAQSHTDRESGSKPPFQFFHQNSRLGPFLNKSVNYQGPFVFSL